MIMCTRKPWLATRISSPSCSLPGPRKAKSIEAIVACGLGSLAGEAAVAIVNVVRGGVLAFDARSAATYRPGARWACAVDVPLFACGLKTIEAIRATLFGSPAAALRN